jgi:hypothetical protein
MVHVHSQDPSSVFDLITRSWDGIHYGWCGGRWYVFRLFKGQLQWCTAFATEAETMSFYGTVAPIHPGSLKAGCTSKASPVDATKAWCTPFSVTRDAVQQYA